MQLSTDFNYTYYQKRKCLHCGSPIPDQAHAARKFCIPLKLPDGSIKNCKDDFHAENRKEENLPYRLIGEFHKRIHQNILNLYASEKEIVSLDKISQYGIDLSRPVKFIVDTDQGYFFYFIEFGFKQLPGNQFKIFKHEYSFK